MTLIRRFFSGPSLMQAVLAAARHHDVDPEGLAYEVIDKKHGFLKTPRGVVIEVDPERPSVATDPAPPPVAEVDPAPAPPIDRLEALTDPVQADSPAVAPAAPVELAPPAPEMPAAEVPLAEAPTPETSTPEAPTPEPPNPQLVDAEWSPPAAPAPDLPAYDLPAPPAPDLPTLETPLPAASDTGSPAAEPPAAEPSDAKWWDAEPAAPEPGPAVEPSPGEAPSTAPPQAAAVELDDDLRQTVAQAVDELVYLAGLRVQVASVVAVDDGLTVELEGPDSDRVAAHGGRALLAIQHLLPRLLFSKLGRAMHCRLDCEGFHAERTARLGRLALKAAERVRGGGRSWLLEPMAPDERRLVHLALADEPDVETESVGEGYLKRVRVARV